MADTDNVKLNYKRMRDKIEHEDYIDKKKKRDRASIPEDKRYINGRLYNLHGTFKNKQEAESEALKKKDGNFTHIDKKKDGWGVYLLPTS